MHRPSWNTQTIQPLLAFNVAGAVGQVPATEDQLVNWVKENAPPGTAENNIRGCIAFFMAHNGKDSGGGTKYKISGQTIFHASEGKKAKNNGCTIFFIVQPNVKITTANTEYPGKIIAIGQHIDNTAYKIHWKDPICPFGADIRL